MCECEGQGIAQGQGVAERRLTCMCSELSFQLFMLPVNKGWFVSGVDISKGKE